MCYTDNNRRAMVDPIVHRTFSFAIVQSKSSLPVESSKKSALVYAHSKSLECQSRFPELDAHGRTNGVAQFIYGSDARWTCNHFSQHQLLIEICKVEAAFRVSFVQSSKDSRFVFIFPVEVFGKEERVRYLQIDGL